MKKLKRICFSGLAGLSVLSFASCGENESAEEDEIVIVDSSKTEYIPENAFHSGCTVYKDSNGNVISYEFDDTGSDYNNKEVDESEIEGYELSDFEVYVKDNPNECYVTGYHGDSKSIVIPDEIYGLKVVGIYSHSSDDLFPNGDVDKFEFSSNVKYVSIAGMTRTICDYETFTCYTVDGINIGELVFNGSLDDYLDIQFGGFAGNPMYTADKVTIDGKDVKNLKFDNDTDFSGSSYSFTGDYIESITLPKNCSTYGYHTFDFDNLNEKIYNTDDEGHKYLKSANNDYYMLAKFNDDYSKIKKEDGYSTATINKNTKMICGWAWTNCIYNDVVISPNVDYFTAIGDYTVIMVAEESGYPIFNGRIRYTGSFESWLGENFLYAKNDNYDNALYESYSEKESLVTHNPISLATEFKCNDLDYEFGEETRSIDSIEIPDGVKEVNKYALEGVSASSIKLPKSLKKIGAFGVGALKWSSASSIYYEGSINDWLKISFDSYYANPAYNAYSIEYSHYLYCNNKLVSDLVIPEGTEKIGKAQFAGLAFNSVTLPSSLKTISSYAFYQMNSGTDMCKILPANYSGNDAYDVVIPETVEKIGAGAIGYYPGGYSVYVPSTVEYVSSWAFANGDRDYNMTDYGNSVYVYTDKEDNTDTKWCYTLNGHTFTLSMTQNCDFYGVEMNDIVSADGTPSLKDSNK
ncbi:MAG: leucine-rich repeat domain-containing protein [Acholeplasmatales bacterium]|nr:leucine-rich repeat domain-containing protein [Acholeplasmatales bacterium]